MSDYRTLTLRQKLERFPPFLAIALSRVRTVPQTPQECRERLWCTEARKERERIRRKGLELPRRKMIRRMTFEEVAKRSGMTYWQIRNITRRLTWDRTSVQEMLGYLEACGVDLMRAERLNLMMTTWLKTGRGFTHLTKQEMAHLVTYANRYKRKRAQNEPKPIPSDPTP